MNKCKVISSASILVIVTLVAVTVLMPTQVAYGTPDLTFNAVMSCSSTGNNLCSRGRATTTGRVGPHMGDTNISANAIWDWRSLSHNVRDRVVAVAQDSSTLGSVRACTGYLTPGLVGGHHINFGRAWRG